jgi:hypothetical protein
MLAGFAYTRRPSQSIRNGFGFWSELHDRALGRRVHPVQVGEIEVRIGIDQMA